MVTRSLEKSGLVVRPQAARFSDNPDEPGEQELTDLLHAQRETRPVTIEKETDVLLDASGQLQQKYRMTTMALTQLCGVLAPNLGSVVMSIAGVRRRPSYPDEEYSPKLAIRLVNELIRSRFDLLRGRGLVIDQKAQVIEGVVGSKYRFLGNLELFDRVKNRIGSRHRFYEASVVGRRMILRYRNPDRAFALPTPHDKLEPFYPGWHFSNSELGDCCVKASAILIRQWSSTASLVPFTRPAKLIHFQGSGFDTKLSKLFELAKKREEGVHEVEEYALAMRNRSLGFDGSRKTYQGQLERIRKTLRKWKISNYLTKEAIARALLHGSYKSTRLESDDGLIRVPAASPTIMAVVKSRTVFDLYNAMCAAAKQGSPDQQEYTEEAAYRLMVNSTTF